MQGTTEDCFGMVVNWTIHNFGCWNGDIHDPAMTTEASSFYRKTGIRFELYPRGLSGSGERLVVRVCSTKGPTNAEGLRGDVCFIGSDGCLLCTREMNGSEVRGSVVEFPRGPNFRDVVEHIKKNGTLHKDRLTVRLRYRLSEAEEIGAKQDTMHSMVDAFETSVKILLEPLEGTSEEFYIMDYPLNKGRMETIGLGIEDSVADFRELRLRVLEEAVENKFAVRTLLSLLSGDGSVLRTEENEHVFRDKEEWVISNSLTKEELSRKGHSVVIDFKFIPSSSHKFLSSHMSLPVKAFEVKPTEIPTPLEASALKEPSSEQSNNSVGVPKTDLLCLKCDNVCFPVHRAILSARSPVFKAMLTTDIKEASSGSVDIVDLDPSTLGLFLTYLYTGTLEDLQGKSALKLYDTADKYQVPSLKRECANFLSANYGFT